MTTGHTFHADIKLLKELVYDKCFFELKHLQWHIESVEYGACSYELGGKKIEQRFSKTTPAKTGQFVTIWKRDKNGITQPFDIYDDFDYFVITSKSDNNIGQFIFPKTVLAYKGIISQSGKGGKRGMRVYPPWCATTNKQAEQSQNWQKKYFALIREGSPDNLDTIKKLFDITLSK